MGSRRCLGELSQAFLCVRREQRRRSVLTERHLIRLLVGYRADESSAILHRQTIEPRSSSRRPIRAVNRILDLKSGIVGPASRWINRALSLSGSVRLTPPPRVLQEERASDWRYPKLSSKATAAASGLRANSARAAYSNSQCPMLVAPLGRRLSSPQSKASSPWRALRVLAPSAKA
mgnify:CR=1 FL=1